MLREREGWAKMVEGRGGGIKSMKSKDKLLVPFTVRIAHARLNNSPPSPFSLPYRKPRTTVLCGDVRVAYPWASVGVGARACMQSYILVFTLPVSEIGAPMKSRGATIFSSPLRSNIHRGLIIYKI